jgi:hypothetical protein
VPQGFGWPRSSGGPFKPSFGFSGAVAPALEFALVFEFALAFEFAFEFALDLDSEVSF